MQGPDPHDPACADRPAEPVAALLGAGVAGLRVAKAGGYFRAGASAEALAVLTLGLIVGVPLLTGYAQWWEIVIILAGLALLAFEIFVFPGHFVSGIIGFLMVVGGLVMTFVPKEPGGMPGIMPSLNGTYIGLERGLIAVVSGMFCSLLLWIWLVR